ncbi:MAG TPA: hydroxymethylpyrimidine/phosphomethylpyrimidine kinase [Cycloclasticus sp.]|jgi:hydroxymethylpyrimidine/phosphomethylpyrimidine kinase|nr:hydroxymethylpyrimidine/phosphomethylpyrimidine kinase [Cycloclasticus sp.]
MTITHIPTVLCFSGHDPSGGAGVQSDIEVLTHFNCHPCSALTCLTVQDSSTVYRLIPLSANDITEQANSLFNDMTIDVIKIGLTGSVECVEAIAKLIQQHPNIPVIFDPVLASGDGTSLASNQLIESIKQHLLALVTVLTPNTLEARLLTGLSSEVSVELLGQHLLATGVDYVLITGGHENGDSIINTLFHNGQTIEQNSWERLTGEFHGSGCTLATAIAAQIALGNSISEAINIAQQYTDNALKNAVQIGKGQLFPNRIG